MATTTNPLVTGVPGANSLSTQSATLNGTSFTPDFSGAAHVFAALTLDGNGTINAAVNNPSIGSTLTFYFAGTANNQTVMFDASYKLPIFYFQDTGGLVFPTIRLIWNGTTWERDSSRTIRYEQPPTVPNAGTYTPSFSGADDLVCQMNFANNSAGVTTGTIGITSPTDGWHSGALLSYSINVQNFSGGTITFDSNYGFGPLTLAGYTPYHVAFLRTANGKWVPIQADAIAPATIALTSGTTATNTSGLDLDLYVNATYNGNQTAAQLTLAMCPHGGTLQTVVTKVEPIGSVNGVQKDAYMCVPAGWDYAVTWNAQVSGVTATGVLKA